MAEIPILGAMTASDSTGEVFFEAVENALTLATAGGPPEDEPEENTTVVASAWPKARVMPRMFMSQT